MEAQELFSSQVLTHLPSLTNLKVLVVESEVDSIKLWGLVLTEVGAELFNANSIKQALTLLQSYLPDILISNIRLPDGDGHLLIRKVRSLEAECGGQIPAIVVADRADTDDRIRSLAAGFQVHLSKPIDLSELIKLIAELTGHGR